MDLPTTSALKGLLLMTTFSGIFAVVQECTPQGYTVLSEYWRNASLPRPVGDPVNCDFAYAQALPDGWYRFLPPAGVALPTTCVPKHHCGTHTPVWMNGIHPTVEDGVVIRQVCLHWDSSCCNWQGNIQVRKCPGDFFVYRHAKNALQASLGSLTPCYIAYCATSSAVVAQHSCGEANNVTNGVKTTTGVNVGDTTVYGCDPGYRLVGSSVLRCLANGTWNVSTPLCQRNVEVNCTSNMMAFTIHKDYLGLQSAASLSLNSPACRPTDRGDALYFSWSLSDCGNIVTHSGNKTTYTNTLQTAQARGALITRNHDNKLMITCTFDNNAVVSSGGVLPGFQQQTFSEQGFGQYTIRLDITDSSYTTSMTNFPVQVQLQDLIYFRLNVQSTAALDIFAVHCYATPLASATSTPQYVFLKEDCPQDQTLFINSSSSDSMTFGMEAFKFLGSYQYMYAHCEVIVCHTSQSGNRCAQGCLSGSGRKRRQAADGSFYGGSSMHTISQGPFTRAMTTTVTEKGGQNSGSVHLVTSNILLFLVAILLLL